MRSQNTKNHRKQKQGNSQSGMSMLFYIALISMIGILAASMLTMFDTASRVAATVNHHKLAYYMAESGLRYGMSQLKNTTGSIDQKLGNINGIPLYTVEGDKEFELSVSTMGAFESDSGDKVTGNSNFTVRQPGSAPFPEGLEFPDSGLTLIASYDISSNPSALDETAVEGITFNSDRTLGYILCSDALDPPDSGILYFLAADVTSNVTLNAEGGSVTTGPVANDDQLFPPSNGIISVTGKKKNKPDKNSDMNIDLKYSTKTCTASSCTFSNLQKVDGSAWDTSTDSIVVNNDDYVVLNSLNHLNAYLSAKGYSGTGGDKAEMEIVTNVFVEEDSRTKKDSITHSDPTNIVESDPSKNPITLTGDPGLDLGAEEYNAFGAAWYSGTKEGVGLYCVDGVCDLGKGVRVFFTIKFKKLYGTWFGSDADGFVFGLINGTENNYYDIGGDAQLGELIAWAGDSRVGSSKSNLSYWVDNDATTPGKNQRDGITPPKIGVEFDTWLNGSAGCQCYGSSAGQYNTAVRSESDQNHIGYVFWGSDTASGGCGDDFDCLKVSSGSDSWTDAGILTYDDNMHGSGAQTSTPARPQNTTYSDSFNNTKTSSNETWWDPDDDYPYGIRIEIHRELSPVDDSSSPYNGMYKYTMKTWVHKCPTTSCSDYVSSGTGIDYSFADLEGDLSTTDASHTDYGVDLEQEIYLQTAEHDLMDTVLLGFTEATGGATQRAQIRNFELKFRLGGDYSITDSNFVN